MAQYWAPTNGFKVGDFQRYYADDVTGLLYGEGDLTRDWDNRLRLVSDVDEWGPDEYRRFGWTYRTEVNPPDPVGVDMALNLPQLRAMVKQ